MGSTEDRLVIDAMNLIGSRADRWWNDPARAMRNLAVELDDYAGATGEDVTVVFDSDPGRLPPVNNVGLVVARRRGRGAADHEIEQIVAADAAPERITVVTSDRRLAERVRALGARVVGVSGFRRRLDAVGGTTP